MASKTALDLVKELLCKGGITEAVGMDIKLKDGSRIVVHSDDHPVLSTPAEQVASVTPRQSAEGGTN